MLRGKVDDGHIMETVPQGDFTLPLRGQVDLLPINLHEHIENV